MLRNYTIQLGGSLGSAMSRGFKSAKASASRGLRSTGKSISKGAKGAKDSMRKAKDEAAWAAMSDERKCNFCSSMGDMNSYDNTCYKIKKDKEDKLAAKNKAKEDRLAALTEQMNMHYNQAAEFGSNMQPDNQANSMNEARIIAKEIAFISGQPYTDPFKQGVRPDVN